MFYFLITMLENIEILQEAVTQNLVESSLRERVMHHITKKRIAAGLTAILLFQNVDTFLDGYSYQFGGGAMTPEVAGCEYAPPVEEVLLPTPAPTSTPEKSLDQDTLDVPTPTPTPATTNPTGDIEKEATLETSSADNNNWLDVVKNIPTFFEQKNDTYKHFEQSYTSELSGINFEIYNTGVKTKRTIDYGAFDELFHLSLTTRIEHDNPNIQDLMDCVKRRVLIEKELAGRTIKILIPSTADYCISNWVLKQVEDRRDNDCTQSGAALPKIEFEVLMFKPYSEQLYIITAGDLDAKDEYTLNHMVSNLFIHESIHRIFYELGVSPRKDPDEQIRKYLQKIIMIQFDTDAEIVDASSKYNAKLYKRRPMPIPIHYTDVFQEAFAD